MTAAISLYAALAFALRPQQYHALLGYYLAQLFAFAGLFAVVLLFAAMLARPRAPLSYVVDRLRREGPNLLLTAAGVAFGLSAFTTYKLAIPELVPFYADPILADIDAWLHGGWNPGELAHWLLPSWAQYPLAWLYGPFWFFQWFGFLALMALHPDSAFRRRYFWSMSAAICLLGTVAALALSSVGPIFYEPIYGVPRFGVLMHAIAQSAVGSHMAGISAYLFENYQTGGHALGTGISAMPSMHVAIVTLNALMLRRLNRRAGVLGWTYLGLILLGSVYLGWHYAIDGYLSIVVVCAIWWATGKVFEPHAVSAMRGSMSHLTDPAPDSAASAILPSVQQISAEKNRRNVDKLVDM